MYDRIIQLLMLAVATISLIITLLGSSQNSEKIVR